MFFVPPAGSTSLTVLVNDSMAGIATATVRRLEPRATVSATRLSQSLSRFRREAQVITSYASGLAGLALVLATIGVYGAFSYSVEQRRREVGIRMALGATTGGIVGMIVRRDMRPVLGGLTAGFALSFAASKVLESQLYGVNRLDGLAHAGVLLLLFFAGLAASALPARRAASIDPAKALYAE